ncbi:MAG: cyclase family protein, partial [Flavobacteriales bacterium]
YSNTNFPYMTAEATAWLASMGVEHLLVDLPSIDREEDCGELLAHHAFWQYPQNTRRGCTISEMIFVPNEITDGEYLLLLAPASFANDAAPSRVVLYRPLD